MTTEGGEGIVLSDLPYKKPANRTFLQVLPRRIVKYRELRAVSQAALAKAAHISRSTLNSIEGGFATDMKVSTLERLCHSLGVSGDALLGYNTVKLVRKPKLKGLSADGPLVEAVAQACATCGSKVAARVLHLPGDCMLELSDAGATAGRIGAVFGLSSAAIEGILREGHESRRHRKF
jgi:transcriptional regulator with XRE-family HTH domain